MSNVKTKAVEKSGGDVNYYVVEILEPKRLIPYTAECEDIIEALNMTFSEGNVFKALWRSCASRTLGLQKEGEDIHGVYDGDKIAYYGARTAAVRKRKQKKEKLLVIKVVSKTVLEKVQEIIAEKYGFQLTSVTQEKELKSNVLIDIIDC